MDYIVQTFVDYYNQHRLHQSKSNRVLVFPDESQLSLASDSQPLGLVRMYGNVSSSNRDNTPFKPPDIDH